MHPLTKIALDAYPSPASCAWPEFKSGDTLVVHVALKEGNKEYIQPFEGVVIRKRGSCAYTSTYTVHAVYEGVGVTRVFAKLDPSIVKVEVKRRGIVRRARLNYLQDRQGKSASVKSKIGVR